MRKKLSLLLLVIMIFTAGIPAQVSAAESDMGLENAIKTAKSMFNIPEALSQFDYSVSTRDGINVWYLNWTSPSGIEGGVNIAVDEKGSIIQYGMYTPYDYSERPKLPKISREQGKAIAEEFLNKVNPAAAKQLKYQENYYDSVNDFEYYFNHIRQVEGIPFYMNNVSISVNKQTGEVRNFYMNWNESLSFPGAANAIGMDAAKKAFVEKMGLELKYAFSYNNDKLNIFAAYMPKYRSNEFIDAVTGEKISLSEGYGIYSYDQAGMGGESAKSSAAPDLTKEEIDAIEKVGKLISKEEAEKIARELKSVELSDEFFLNNSNLSRGWPDKGQFIWNLNFSNDNGTGRADSRYVSVSIDAENKEIKNFSTYFPREAGEEQKPAYGIEDAKKAAQELLMELLPGKFNESFYDETNERNYPVYREEGMPEPSYYNIVYTRKVNGIPFPGNSLNVGFDAVSGKITSFYSEWFNVQFPSVANVLPLEKINENFFNEIGLELQYVTRSIYYPMEKIAGEGQRNIPEVKLVYGARVGKPVMFDANTGVVIDYTGAPYKERKPAAYTDISGHYAENMINALAEQGITLEGAEFKPDEKILQKEYLKMLSRLADYYSPTPMAETSEEYDRLYAYLMTKGVIKEGEKNPDAFITKEDAVKFIIRAINYDEVADIKGIFISGFSDDSEINPDLIGYVAIAKGLKIVSGYNGNFNPKTELTRAQGAVVVYNYLSR